jgi:hypothetical protein
VAEVLPLSEGELRLLGSLLRHRVRFMIVGLSAAALQGAPVVTEDVDLWFEDLNDPRFLQALREVGAAYVPPFGHNPPMLAGTHTEPFDLVISMSGLGKFADEIKQARDIRVGKLRVKVLSLERILVSKTAANRPKDQRVIPTLQNVLCTVVKKRAPKKPSLRNLRKSSRANKNRTNRT